MTNRDKLYIVLLGLIIIVACTEGLETTILYSIILVFFYGFWQKDEPIE